MHKAKNFDFLFVQFSGLKQSLTLKVKQMFYKMNIRGDNMNIEVEIKNELDKMSNENKEILLKELIIMILQ